MIAAARRPKEGQFKVPYKGSGSVKRLAKPLHNPLAKDAVIVFNPVDLFSEKYVFLYCLCVVLTQYSKIAVVVDPILGG